MASMIELRTRIKGVEETLKITNAMYLISSSKLKKARKQLKEVEPYFDRIAFTISDILHHSPVLDHPYLRTHKTGNPKIGYLVITGDKGLAGAYHPHI
ncbi:MAG: F0F1 ATP synthase subunit gamma, partial [Oscillospiraceae bacterium]